MKYNSTMGERVCLNTDGFVSNQCTDTTELNGEYVCMQCGVVVPGIIYYEKYRRYTTCDYVREEYVNQMLGKYLGIDIPKSLYSNGYIQGIIDAVPDEWTWKDIYDVSCARGGSKTFFYLPYLLGLGPEICPLYNEFQYQYSNNFHMRNNRPNIWYVLYKFNEVGGYSTISIPLKLSKKVIAEYDRYWKGFCDCTGFEYRTTQIKKYSKSLLCIKR